MRRLLLCALLLLAGIWCLEQRADALTPTQQTVLLGAGPSLGPLDVVPGATVAICPVRACSRAYKSAISTVRRSSDSATLALQPSARGGFPAGTYNGFIGSSSGAAPSANDQTGNGDTFSQATAADQPSYVIGSANYLSFNGSSDYLVSVNNAGLTVSSTFSVCAWVNSASTNADPILNTAIEHAPFDGIWLTWGTTPTKNKPIISFVSTSGNTEEVQVTASALNNSQWYHLCWTYDGSQTIGGIKIYINGANAATAVVENTGFGTMTDRAWHVGSDAYTTPVDYFPGAIDDVLVYPFTLTLSQVAAIYAVGR